MNIKFYFYRLPLFLFPLLLNLVSFGQLLDIPNMFNTGENVEYGQRDTNYRYGTADGLGAAVHDNITPVGEFWMENTETSKWISNVFNGDSGAGAHNFFYAYSLEGFDHTTASITGLIGIDNNYRILHNGVEVVASATGNFNEFLNFAINDNFVEGNNVIQFVVDNTGVIPSPMALRVEFVTATAEAIPEPSTYVLFSGILVFALTVFKRKMSKLV